MRYFKKFNFVLFAWILAGVFLYIYPQKTREQKETSSRNRYSVQILQRSSVLSLPEVDSSSNASIVSTQPTGIRSRSTSAETSQSVKKEPPPKEKENILTKYFLQDLSAYILEQFYPISRYVDEFLNKLQHKAAGPRNMNFETKTKN